MVANIPKTDKTFLITEKIGAPVDATRPEQFDGQMQQKLRTAEDVLGIIDPQYNRDNVNFETLRFINRYSRGR